jgi:mono/diheme cytochrome c family protein
MHMRGCVLATAGLLFVASLAVSARQATSTSTTAQPKSSGGWTLPPDAADEKNPFAGDPKAIETGKALFKKHCERCHGRAPRGPQSRWRRLLQGVERPLEAENAVGEGRPHERAALADRQLRADAASEVVAI